MPVSFTKNARVHFGLCFFLAARAETGRQKKLVCALPQSVKGGSQIGKAENQFHVWFLRNLIFGAELMILVAVTLRDSVNAKFCLVFLGQEKCNQL